MVRITPRLKALPVVAALSMAVAADAHAECTITVLGDSLSAGFGLEASEAFPEQLGRALEDSGYACTVINAGVSGDTTSGGRARLAWVLSDAPSHLIVELGGNDGLRAIPPATVEDNLDAIVAEAVDADIDVLLTGMLAPPNLGAEYGDAFADVFPRVAERHDVAFYPFFLDGVAAEPALNQPDGIHPTAEGIAVIVERILPVVTEWLDGTVTNGE